MYTDLSNTLPPTSFDPPCLLVHIQSHLAIRDGDFSWISSGTTRYLEQQGIMNNSKSIIERPFTPILLRMFISINIHTLCRIDTSCRPFSRHTSGMFFILLRNRFFSGLLPQNPVAATLSPLPFPLAPSQFQTPSFPFRLSLSDSSEKIRLSRSTFYED